jgi:hypothetical protein
MPQRWLDALSDAMLDEQRELAARLCETALAKVHAERAAGEELLALA